MLPEKVIDQYFEIEKEVRRRYEIEQPDGQVTCDGYAIAAAAILLVDSFSSTEDNGMDEETKYSTPFKDSCHPFFGVK